LVCGRLAAVANKVLNLLDCPGVVVDSVSQSEQRDSAELATDRSAGPAPSHSVVDSAGI
jgi:hypothetical protein